MRGFCREQPDDVGPGDHSHQLAFLREEDMSQVLVIVQYINERPMRKERRRSPSFGTCSDNILLSNNSAYNRNEEASRSTP